MDCAEVFRKEYHSHYYQQMEINVNMNDILQTEVEYMKINNSKTE